MTGLVTRDPLLRRWSVLIYVMLGRLLLLLLLLPAIPALLRFEDVSWAFYFFLAMAFLVTIPYALWLHRGDSAQENAGYQFAVDALLTTGLIHFTGGITSQLSLLYPLLILAAGIVVSGRLALQVTLLSVFFYATAVFLEMSGVLPYRGTAPLPYGDAAEVVQVLMLRTVIFVLFAAASSYLADRCLFQGKQLARVRVIANSIIDNVSVPLLAVYEDGHVMLANKSAARMLHTDVDKLKGQEFSDFFPEDAPSLGSEADAKRIWQMKCSDGEVISVTFEAAKGSFPAAVIGSLAEQSRGVDLYIVALRDMTRLLAEQDESRLSERQRTAANMLTEMAHVVRNPLTAIRGAGELLETAVSSMFKEANQITEADWETVRSMCEVIFEQTRELDDKVGYFLKCASQNSGELLDLVANADDWTSKVTANGGGHAENSGS